MRLAKLSFQNIRKMFRSRPIIAVLLIMGIIVSSCAINIYVSQSVSASKVISGLSTTERVLDYDASGLGASSYAKISKYLSENGDNISFYSVMSVENTDIDIIGIVSANPVFEPDTGDWMSKGQVVVPYKLSDKQYDVGDNFSLNGKDYKVSGIYPSMWYEGKDYSSRRMTLVDYTAAGVAVDDELKEKHDDPYDTSVREAVGVFMTLPDFVEGGYSAQVLRIKFAGAVSPAEKAEFSEAFMDYCSSKGIYIAEESAAMQAAAKVYSFQFISEFLVYIIISVISLINTLSLFTYVIKQNRMESMTYLSLGATRKKVLIITLLETVIYIIPAYTVGFFLSKLVIALTDLEQNMSYYGIGQYLGILSGILCLSLAFVLIYQYFLIRKARSESEPLFSFRGLLKLTGLKNLYLTLKNYSANIFSELVIILQVVLVAFSFSYVAAFYFQRGANSRIVDRMFGGREVYVCGYSQQLSSELWFGDIQYFYTLEKVPLAKETIECISEMEGLDGYGCMSASGFHYGNATEAYCLENDLGFAGGGTIYSLSPAVIRNLEDIEVGEGEWLDKWADGVDMKENEIPIVISPSIAERYGLKCGDIVEKCVFQEQYLKKGSIRLKPVLEDGEFVRTNLSPYEKYNFKVVGILSDKTRIYAEGCYPLVVEESFPTLARHTENTTGVIYCPVLYKNGEEYFGNYPEQTGMLLFPDGSKDIEYYRDKYEKYGPVFDFKEIADTYDGYYESGTSQYAVHLYITTALLIIGVAGYNLLSVERNKKTYGIYYSCGMHWKKSLSIAITSNSIIFLSGGIIGTVWGIVSANSTRVMANDTIIYSALTSLGFILLLFAVSTISVFAQISKLTPISLIKKGD